MESLDLQQEVDRKAFDSLNLLLDAIDNGQLQPDAAELLLSLFNSAFAGLVEHDRDLRDMVDSMSAMITRLPRPHCQYRLLYHTPDDQHIALYYDSDLRVRLVKVGGSDSGWVGYDNVAAQAKRLAQIHDKLLKRGYTICK